MWSQHFPEPISGLSSATSLAILRVEQASGSNYVFVGSTHRAFMVYRAFTRKRGPSYPMPVGCQCPDCPFESVVHARDVLELVAERLPVRARAEFRRELRRLDAEFLRRRLRDPFHRHHFWNVIEFGRPDPGWYDRFPGHPWWDSP